MFKFLIPYEVGVLRRELEEFYPPEIDHQKKFNLRHGWLLDQLISNDKEMWRRWDLLDELNFDPEKAFAENFRIPQIPFPSRTKDSHVSTLCMLEFCVNQVNPDEHWDANNRGWEYLEYFLDWLLFGLAYHGQKTLPQEPVGCKGASDRIYQSFQLTPMQVWPNDYFGDLLLISSLDIEKSEYFSIPTNQDCAESTQESLDYIGVHPTDLTHIASIGTGRYLLHASNYSLNIIGQEIDSTLLKMALVNCYLYAPWFVFPIPGVCEHYAWAGEQLIPPHQKNKIYQDITRSADDWSDFITDYYSNYQEQYEKYRDTEFDRDNWWRYAPFLKRKFVDVPDYFLVDQDLYLFGAI